MQITFSLWSSHETTKLCCSSSQNCVLFFFFFFPSSAASPVPTCRHSVIFRLVYPSLVSPAAAWESVRAGLLCSGNKIPFYPPWDFFFFSHIRINWCISWSRHAVSLPKVCIVHNSLIPVTFSPGSCSVLSQNTVQCGGAPLPSPPHQPPTQNGRRGWHLNQACQKYRTKPTSIHSASRQRTMHCARTLVVWQLLHGDEPTTTAFIQPALSFFQCPAHRF